MVAATNDDGIGPSQRITRLTPLADVLAGIDARVEPVAPRGVEAAAALGRTLAEDVVIQAPIPAVAVALRDGWAVKSELTADAGPYMPAPLPAAVRVDAGEPLPRDADAVALIDAVTIRNGAAHALAPVGPGEGVLPVAADGTSGDLLIESGRRLGPLQRALLAAAGIGRVRVREPRLHLVGARPAHDAVIDAAIECTADAIRSDGGVAFVHAPAVRLNQALSDPGADALVVVGGTGSGRNDTTVRTLAAAGVLHVHGIALIPGETAAFASVGPRPVLALPGRLDAALSVWLVVGRRLLARLAGSSEGEPATKAPLARKIASPLGLAEVIPVRMRDGAAEPIASGYLPVTSLAQANGWVLVPADSEGYPPGAEVMIRAWP
jgi:molybdopterin molybdotransferase